MAKRNSFTISFFFLLFFAALANALNMTAALAEVPTYAWTTTEIHDGVDPSIAIDSSGNPHICFGKDDGNTGQPTHIFYGYRVDNVWQCAEIALRSNSCAETSITIDNNNKVHILYATEYGQGVWHITNKSGSWQSTQIKSTWTANYASFCMDDNYKLHAAYWNNNSWETQGLQINYRYNDGTSWQAIEPLGALSIKYYNTYTAPAAIAVTHETNPVPHVIAEKSSGGLIHYYKTETGWASERFGIKNNIVDDANTTIQFDHNNVLYAVIVRTLADGSKYLLLAKKENAIWTYELITTLDHDSYGRVSLAMDSQNRPNIAFFSGEQLYYGIRDNGKWTFQEIQYVPYANGPENVMLALDGANLPRVTYSTINPKKIYYAEARIAGTNQPPLITPIGTKTIEEGKLLMFAVTAQDPDSDVLTYSAEPITGENFPLGCEVNNDDGSFAWIPTYEQVGIYKARVKVNDNKGGEDTENIQITVQDSPSINVQEGESIQNAIDSASGENPVIYVSGGTYEENLEIQKSIQLIGDTNERTIIKGNIVCKEANAVIQNLNIFYGKGDVISFSNAQYVDLRLTSDAGITAINSNLTVKNCIIKPDPAVFDALPVDVTCYGKGIQIWNMYKNPIISPQIENNIIQNADCAIYCFAQAFSYGLEGELKNNTFYDNNCGIILRMHNEKPVIKNNIITGKEAGVFLTYRDGSLLDERKPLIHHNDVWNNTNNYWVDETSSIFSPLSGSGSISADPLFADVVNDDFSLKDDSPCVGKADDGGDMGAKLMFSLPPSPPVVSYLPQATNEQDIEISGKKDSNASVIINGIEVIPPDTDTEWTVPSYGLGSDGDKTLIFTSKNIYGQTSSEIIMHITLDRTAPTVAITFPQNGATLNTAPITVTGTLSDPTAYVDVNGVFADISGNIFTAEGVNLKYGSNTIKATAIDPAGNITMHQITITSTVTSDYDLIKITMDTYPGDPENPIAGSQVELKARFAVEGVPRPGEPIQFTVKSGNGTLSQSVINTDSNGDVTTILTTDTNAMAVNEVEAYAVNFPGQKITFRIDTKANQAAYLLKVTDNAVRPVPGVSINLITKLVDQNDNPIANEAISYSIISGTGTLSASTSTTTAYGEASVAFTAGSSPNTTTVIQAQSVTYPTLSVLFNITTGQASSVTFEQVMAKVQENADKILDLTADVVATTNEPGAVPEERYKIWRKGDKGKIEMTYPEQKILLTMNTPSSIIIGDEELQISEYVPIPGEQKQDVVESINGDIYVLKSSLIYPDGISKDITYYEVDYGKGVITKMQQISSDPNNQIQVNTTSLYQETGGAWVLSGNTIQVTNFKTRDQYEMSEIYLNTTVNSGLPDSIFE